MSPSSPTKKTETDMAAMLSLPPGSGVEPVPAAIRSQAKLCCVQPPSGIHSVTNVIRSAQLIRRHSPLAAAAVAVLLDRAWAARKAHATA
jgi:hypothetical protein